MPITAAQLAKSVKDLRDVQKLYFKSRDVIVLQKAKHLEKEVDLMVESVLSYKHPETGNLFE
jgi:hypothetical protein